MSNDRSDSAPFPHSSRPDLFFTIPSNVGSVAPPTDPVRSNHVFSHWFAAVDGFRASPSQFYTVVLDKIAEQGITHLRVRQIACREGGFLAPRRLYLRVQRQEMIFDVCGVPSGSSFFVSWWLGRKPPTLLRRAAFPLADLPIVGWPFRVAVGRTYYHVDSMLMFQHAVHRAVVAAIEAMSETQGLRRPPALEAAPVTDF